MHLKDVSVSIGVVMIASHCDHLWQKVSVVLVE